MDGEVRVYVDIEGTPHFAGRLWMRTRQDRESATFEYDRTWLENPQRFSLEPALMLAPGPFHSPPHSPFWGAMGDSAPDRWGRMLMRRAERRRAKNAGQTPRTLREIDYLLMVDDETRQGALRFTQQEGGPFLADHRPDKVPPLVELPRLLAAADRIAGENETDEDLRLLLAPGSSLGGARPKASTRDRGGHLSIAKFASKSDDIRSVLWEALSLRLAGKAGIEIPICRIETANEQPVLLSRRFDRNGARRIPFVSAMSMLSARDNEERSYLELADALRRYGAEPIQDMKQLWRRMVFNILISNTDDHLRNHGFLYAGPGGWRLSPAYDLNPVPIDVKPRILSTAITLDDRTASLDLAFEVAGYFGLTPDEARQAAYAVGNTVSRWRKEAVNIGLSKTEVERMASAFEHADLKAARQTG